MNEISELLARRLRTTSNPSLGSQRAVVTLDTGEGGRWSVETDHGTPRLLAEPAAKANTTIHTRSSILRAIISGNRSGIAAFLDGDLTVRGDLHLAMSLDGLFLERRARPPRWPRMEVLQQPGGETAYLEAGDASAPTVVMLHGLAATNASLLPLLWDLADDFHVIAPDMFGFGASSKPRLKYDARHFQRWLSDFMDALDIRHAHLVGNSLGGRVSLEMGLVDPDRVESLSLLCPSPAFKKMRQFAPVVRLIRPELLGLGMPASHRIVVEGIRAMFSDSRRLPDAWYDAAADEFLRISRSPSARIALGSALREIYLERSTGEHGFYSRLSHLQVPSLFIWGDRDRLVPSGFARHITAAVPSARSIVLEDSGHVPQFEHRVITSNLVREMLMECQTHQQSQPQKLKRSITPI